MSSAQQFQSSGGPFQHDGPENPTQMGGSNNPVHGGDQKREDGLPQSVAGTLPNDFTLKGMQAEYKGEDKTEPVELKPNSDGNSPLSTAGPPASATQHRKDFQSHEIDNSLAKSDEQGSIQGHGKHTEVH